MPNLPLRIKKADSVRITTPAVFIQEIHPFPAITGVETSHAAFLGSAVRGPLNKALLVQSFADFERNFGGVQAHSELGYAVLLYFANGGKQAWIVRIARKGLPAQTAKGLKALAAESPVNMLSIPGASDPVVLNHAENWCRARHVFLLIDSPRAATPQQMRAAVGASLPESNCAAVYYPWLAVNDPLNPSQPRLTAPCGAVAGLFARTDRNRGVWKAPAGKDPLKLVQSLETALTQPDQDLLNPKAVNCLRYIEGIGFCVWGSRTLRGADASGDEYKYVPMRRLALYIEGSVEVGTRWAVFEPSGEALWRELRRNVEDFMINLWKRGALAGDKAEQAFFVRCGRDTMTQSDLTRGILHVMIGFAPVKPAEFVVLKISHATA